MSRSCGYCRINLNIGNLEIRHHKSKGVVIGSDGLKTRDLSRFIVLVHSHKRNERIVVCIQPCAPLSYPYLSKLINRLQLVTKSVVQMIATYCNDDMIQFHTIQCMAKIHVDKTYKRSSVARSLIVMALSIDMTNKPI